MEHIEGIIDKERNPFICDSWIKQGYKFTTHRAKQLNGIIGLNEKEIRSLNRNKGAYVAFIAIRWSAAKMVNGILQKANSI
jgi:hypothetical protein